MSKRYRLKSLEELEKLGLVYSVLRYDDAVILQNRISSMRSFRLNDFDKEYTVDDTKSVLSNKEMEAYKDFFVEIKEE